MALPTAATKVYLDSASDDPKQARGELATLVDKFNDLLTALGTVAEKNTGTSGDAVPLLNQDGTFSGIITLSKQLRLSGILSPAQVTANQNNYAPTDIGNNAILRLSTDASRNITGLTTGAVGRVLIIFNVGSNDLVLAHQDTNSDAANRIITHNAANLTLTGGTAAFLFYDNTSSRWRVLCHTATPDQVIDANYESGQLSLVAGSNHTLTHNLGGKPKHIDLWLENVTGELGYTTGERILASVNMDMAGTLHRGFAVKSTDTTIDIYVGNTQPAIIRWDTQNAADITIANWRLVVTAIR